MKLWVRSNPLVIGIGNPYRSDDGVGLAVVRHLKERTPGDLRILEASGECTSLIESWKDAAAVILVDAIQSGQTPGTISRFNAIEQQLPAEISRHSTHTLGIIEAVELARIIKGLPPSLMFYGIEGKNFRFGFGLSPEVEASVKKAVDLIIGDIPSEILRRP
jgi:hydrogenase maturation protease